VKREEAPLTCVFQALEFGARQLWDVDFLFMLSLSGEQPVPIEVSAEGPRWSVRSALDPLQSPTLVPHVRILNILFSTLTHR
jgi:hypothetical protein